uniref:Uncharacterized protein n=1 Tax=Knipowitschia caucasica TaxID=637954 RepID=A0AAV2MJR8_KNICA
MQTHLTPTYQLSPPTNISPSSSTPNLSQPIHSTHQGSPSPHTSYGSGVPAPLSRPSLRDPAWTRSTPKQNSLPQRLHHPAELPEDIAKQSLLLEQPVECTGPNASAQHKLRYSQPPPKSAKDRNQCPNAGYHLEPKKTSHQ